MKKTRKSSTKQSSPTVTACDKPAPTEPIDERPILVIGDVMLDRYIQGGVQRISPEAPVPIVNLQQEWMKCGGAGNVAVGLAALGWNSCVAGIVGKDAEAELLSKELMKAGVRSQCLVRASSLRTITKTRVLSSSGQQLLRIDQDSERRLIEASSTELALLVLMKFASFCGVVIADYDKGTVSNRHAAAVVQKCRESGIPCIVDPKRADLSVYKGATLLAPNVMETSRALGRPLPNTEAVSKAARELREKLKLEYMLITRGADGMTLATKKGVSHFPAELREVADVTGAGDTVVAVLAASLLEKTPIEEACRLASTAAAIAVGHRGTFAVTKEALHAAVNGAENKVNDWGSAKSQIEAARSSGKKIVFTNGCFDILHVGHLTCLEQARKQGDYLVVGLNSDASVRKLKGPTRPVLPAHHRAAMLAGLRCVDQVVVFEEETPEELVHHLEPDVLVKGGDYTPNNIAGADFVRNRGGKVVIIPLIADLSTSSILAKGSDDGGK